MIHTRILKDSKPLSIKLLVGILFFSFPSSYSCISGFARFGYLHTYIKQFLKHLGTKISEKSVNFMTNLHLHLQYKYLHS